MEMTPDLNLKIRIRVLSKVLYELTNACGVDCTEDIKKGVLDKQILNEIKLEFLDDEETIRGEIIFLINWEKLEFSAKANEDVSLLKNIDINRLIAPQLDPEVYNSLKLFVDRLKYKYQIRRVKSKFDYRKEYKTNRTIYSRFSVSVDLISFVT